MFLKILVLSHPLGDLGATYKLRLWLVGKRVVDFLLVLIELLSLAITVDTLSRLVHNVQAAACTVVQAVAKANSQSNGKGQILTPWGSETPEQISMKLGIYNQVAGMPTHANPCGAATTWVVWANT